MSDFNRGYPRTATAPAADMSVDAGLRSFMLGVYNKLGLGLVLSAGLAYLFSHQLASVFYTMSGDQLTGFTTAGMVVRWAPLLIIIGAAFLMRNPSPVAAALFYWTIVSLLGASLSIWFMLYRLGSVAQVFLITAAAFGGLSLYGYATKRDLTGIGSFLIMGLIGIVIASVVNIFLGSAMIQFIVSVLGVLIFAGLTAFDTQKLKMTYYQLGGNEAALNVATSYGALRLYLDFINLFQFLMSLMGGGRR
jgi:uncharacterized protein